MTAVVDHFPNPLRRLGIVPGNMSSHGGLGQYSAAIMDAVTFGGLPAGIGSIAILSEGGKIRINGDAQWPIVSLSPPWHPRRYLPTLRALIGANAVARVGRQLRESQAAFVAQKNSKI